MRPSDRCALFQRYDAQALYIAYLESWAAGYCQWISLVAWLFIPVPSLSIPLASNVKLALQDAQPAHGLNYSKCFGGSIFVKGIV